MPVQKGKKNKHRPRGRSRAPVAASEAQEAGGTARPVQRSPRRTLWQGPPWFNAALGIFMLVAGVVFFALPSRGTSLRDKSLFLIAYVVLAGFYLFRAYRGYRSQAR